MRWIKSSTSLDSFVLDKLMDNALWMQMAHASVHDQ